MPYAAQKLTTEIASPGALAGVDWEERVDFARLRDYRRQRLDTALLGSDIGSLVLFDMDNIRYTTAGHTGAWARVKLFRCALVMRGHTPIQSDIGSAAKQHQLHNAWLPEHN